MEMKDFYFLFTTILLINICSSESLLNTIYNAPNKLSTEVKIILENIDKIATTGQLTQYINQVGPPKLLEILEALNKDDAFEVERFIVQALATEAEEEIKSSPPKNMPVRSKRNVQKKISNSIPPQVYQSLSKDCQNVLNEMITQAGSYSLTQYVHSHYDIIMQLYKHMDPLDAHKLNSFVMNRMREESRLHHDNGHHHGNDRDDD